MFTQDPTTLIALLLGRDSQLMIAVILITLLFKNLHVYYTARRWFTHYGMSTVTLEGRIVNDLRHMDQRSIMDPTMRALIHYVNKQDFSKISTGIRAGAYYNLEDNEDFSHNIKTLLPLDPATGMVIAPDIHLFARAQQSGIKQSHASSANSRESDSMVCTETVLTLDLKSPRGLAHIHAFLKDCDKTYEEYLSEEAHKHMILRLTWNSEFLRAAILPIPEHKTFDNMFFDGKAQLIQRLQSFRNKAVYHRLGIPDSLGLLFHGEPGTGKTSAIKAIANYMKMNLIIIPMSSITTRRELELIFYKKCVGTDYEIPYNKRIYVFEEIDCNGWENVVRDRELMRAEAKARATEQVAAKAAALVARGLISGSGSDSTTTGYDEDDDSNRTFKKRLRKSGQDEPLTLGAFLEVLDGIVEIPGRIVIMTTNHPEQLDPALRRPGRIDMELEFKRLRREHIAQIFERWCGETFPADSLPAVADHRFTQADLSRLIFKHEGSPGAFVQELVDLSRDPLPSHSSMSDSSIASMSEGPSEA